MGGEGQGEMPVGKEGQKRISITLGFSLVVKFRRSESPVCVKVEGENRLP